jgi:hypothetical protein
MLSRVFGKSRKRAGESFNVSNNIHNVNRLHTQKRNLQKTKIIIATLFPASLGALLQLCILFHRERDRRRLETLNCHLVHVVELKRKGKKSLFAPRPIPPLVFIFIKANKKCAPSTTSEKLFNIKINVYEENRARRGSSTGEREE